MGQDRSSGDVRVRSAFPPIATKSRTSLGRGVCFLIGLGVAVQRSTSHLVFRKGDARTHSTQIFGSRQGLSAGAWHEAANLRCPIIVLVRPDYGRPKTVGLGYNRGVGHDNPLPINSYTIVLVLSVPVDILHTEAVGK